MTVPKASVYRVATLLGCLALPTLCTLSGCGGLVVAIIAGADTSFTHEPDIDIGAESVLMIEEKAMRFPPQSGTWHEVEITRPSNAAPLFDGRYVSLRGAFSAYCPSAVQMRGATIFVTEGKTGSDLERFKRVARISSELKSDLVKRYCK